MLMKIAQYIFMIFQRLLRIVQDDTYTYRPPPSFLGLACAPIVETRFLELAMSLLDFSPWIPLGTFSISLTAGFFIHSPVCM